MIQHYKLLDCNIFCPEEASGRNQSVDTVFYVIKPPFIVQRILYTYIYIYIYIYKHFRITTEGEKHYPKPSMTNKMKHFLLRFSVSRRFQISSNSQVLLKERIVQFRGKKPSFHKAIRCQETGSITLVEIGKACFTDAQTLQSSDTDCQSRNR